MRLSADLLSQAEQRPNALGERELVLRGLGIPEIQHLGATRDLFDAIDFTDNRLTHLTNFPRLLRLSSLYLAGNVIESVDGKNLGKNLPGLVELNLADNRISGLHEVRNIGIGCEQLQFLNLNGNPVTRRQHYRLYTIHKIPSLKVLDFVKVKDSERERAKRLATSVAGAALEGDVNLEGREAAAQQQQNGTKTFTPGAGQSAKDSFVANFTPEQKTQIKEMIANAKSPIEIERIEECVKRGEFPSSAVGQGDETNLGANGSAKRPLEETNNTNGENHTSPTSKRQRQEVN